MSHLMTRNFLLVLVLFIVMATIFSQTLLKSNVEILSEMPSTQFLSIDVKARMMPRPRFMNFDEQSHLEEERMCQTHLETIESHVKQLFGELLKANDGHPRGLETLVEVQGLAGKRFSPIYHWGGQFAEWRELKIVTKEDPSKIRAGVIKEMRKYFIKSISPCTFQVNKPGALVYRVMVEVESPELWNFGEKVSLCQVTLRYRHSLFSRCIQVIITSTDCESLAYWKKKLATIDLDFVNKCDIGQLAALILDTDQVENWMRVMVAGGRSILPGLTDGDKYIHKKLT